jgi:HEAT repeats
MASVPPDGDPSIRSVNGGGVNADVGANPSDEDVVRTLVEIEKSSTPKDELVATSPISDHGSPPLVRNPNAGNKALVGLVLLLSFAATLVVKRALSPSTSSTSSKFSTSSKTKTASGVRPRSYDRAMQAQAEDLLQRLASGDSAAAEEASAQASTWIGKASRTGRTDQLITTAINLHDMHSRQAALDAELALDGIPQNEEGLKLLTNAVGNPSSRAWALWLLGAIGNRGVDTPHTAKIVGTYLSDPDVNVRASAVNGLSLIATDETVPMLLDRFRNDPSPVVQERAACGLAESGMYTKAQRTLAAESLIHWLDDSLLTSQQRNWDIQALGDISGQHFGADTAAWRSWYESNR